MQSLEPESSSTPEQQALEPQKANESDGALDSGASSELANCTKASHESIQRLTNFLCSRVFIRRRPILTEEWGTCWRLASRIRAGYIKMERIRIPTPPYPSAEVLKAIPTAWGAASNESEDHRWLKYVAFSSAKRAEFPNLAYEQHYGPCLGDVVADGAVIECGDTDPARVECIYDEPMFFISLPYCEEIRNRRLHAFMFSMTPAGLEQRFCSPWRAKQLAWVRYCDDVLGPILKSSEDLASRRGVN